MANKVRVSGKAQNRTALGIVHGYMLIHPKATLSDLRSAFPNSLNPDKGVKENFAPLSEMSRLQPENFDGFFSKPEELLTLSDGTQVALCKMWTKASFERIVEQAKAYDIEVVAYEAADKGFGKKGGYTLECINGFVPATEEKKRGLWWLWVLLALIIACIVLFFTCKREKPAEPQPVVVETPVAEPVVEQVVEEVERNFNAAKFEAGKAELNDQTKLALGDLVKMMMAHPEVKISIEGHTSSEGDPAFNQQLSEARARAAYDYLVEQGVSADCLSYVGKGSTEPVDPQNLDANRRTEFIVK